MLKYRVTNTTQKTAKGPRNVFLTEVGKLLRPGEQCVCNRLDNFGTRLQVEAGDLRIEEGSFAEPLPIPETPPSEKEESPPAAPPSPPEKVEIPPATPPPPPVAAEPPPLAPKPELVEEEPVEPEAPLLTKKELRAQKSSSKKRGGKS